MNMKINYFRVTVSVFLALLMIFAYPLFGEAPQKSGVVKSQHPKATETVDSDWLPDIEGIPNEEQVDSLTRHVDEVMSGEQDKRCNSIDYKLRMLVFQNFVIYQHMANTQNYYFKDLMIQKYAHILAMILKESSGDPTNITDMSGRTVTTNKAATSLEHWNDLVRLTMKNGVKLNLQTNFGLTQLSVDRLFVAFKVTHGADHSKDFLEGKYGDATPGRIDLDTAIAIRRLIWFYQDFAQGRLTQEDDRIPEGDINKPEFSERHKEGIKLALLYCGTHYLFSADNQHNWIDEYPKYEHAMSVIAYCKLGNPHAGYGKNEFDERCFAQWVTLCPALNMNIALLTPLSYFQTRGSQPVCIGTLNHLLNRGPKTESPPSS